jgi:hypothetical protein
MLCVSQGKITHSKPPSDYFKKIEAGFHKRVVSDPKWGFSPSLFSFNLNYFFSGSFRVVLTKKANLTLPYKPLSLGGGGGSHCNEKQGGVSHYGLAIYIFFKKILRKTKNYRKIKYLTMQKYNLQKII